MHAKSNETELSLEVTGLNCAGCAGRAERALAGVEGVTEASVNLANSAAVVSGQADLDVMALRDALAQAGYPAGEREVDLDIDHLTCASCVGRVERALSAVPGVVSAEVNLAQEQAHVR